MAKKVNCDVVVGIILLLFSAWVFYLAVQIQGESGLLPKVLTGLMALCAAVIVVNGVRKTKDAENTDAVNLLDHKHAFLFMLAIVAYYVVFRYVAYWVATPIFLIVAQKWLKVKSWKTILIVTVVYTVTAFLLFVVLLKLPIYRVGALGRYFRFV